MKNNEEKNRVNSVDYLRGVTIACMMCNEI